MKPKALILSNGADTGGCAVRAAEAFAHDPNATWEVRSMVTNPGNYIDYPIDMPFSPRLLARMYDEADVVVLNSTMYGHHRYDDTQGKPTILMLHGFHPSNSHYAQSTEEIITEASYLGAKIVGTTIDFPALTDGIVGWMPTPVDFQGLMNMRISQFGSHDPSDPRTLIGHFPTHRAVKSTEAVIAAVNRLKSDGFNVELLLLEGVSNETVLRAKARDIDIMVDQLHLGYGVNAIEAWAMGIPVVAGVADTAVRFHMRQNYRLPDSPTGLPFVEATEDDLAEVLAWLVMDINHVQEAWGALGRLHVLRWHSRSGFVQRFTELLNAQRNVPTMPGQPRRRKDWPKHGVATTA